jgi:hypothetical protein
MFSNFDPAGDREFRAVSAIQSDRVLRRPNRFESTQLVLHLTNAYFASVLFVNAGEFRSAGLQL